jgi:hypothetical protein
MMRLKSASDPLTGMCPTSTLYISLTRLSNGKALDSQVVWYFFNSFQEPGLFDHISGCLDLETSVDEL